MHSLSICTSCQSMDRLLTTRTTPIQKLPIGSRGSLELISMLIFQTLLKYNMQKRRLNSLVNHKSSFHPYLEVETLLLSLLLLHVTNTNPLNFSWQLAMIPIPPSMDPREGRQQLRPRSLSARSALLDELTNYGQRKILFGRERGLQLGLFSLK